MTSFQPVRDEDDRGAQTFIDWFRINTRWLTIGAGVVVVAAAGYWFYTRSAQIKRDRSARDLMAARQSIATGNAPLAQSDLQKLLTRYEGTPASVEAAMLLAELSYERGEYQKGIDALQKIDGDAGGANAASRVQGLIGDGQMQLGKVDDALASYQKAADVARTDGEKAVSLAKKARALMAVNKLEDAKKIWSELSSAAWATTVQAEAKVRLGEINALAANQS